MAKSTACITKFVTASVATIAVSTVAIDIASVDIAIDTTIDIAIDIDIAGVAIAILPLLLSSL